MDITTNPCQYRIVDLSDIKLHIKHASTIQRDYFSVDFLLCEAGVVIPITRRSYKTKADIIEFQLRSGSISRENLSQIKQTLMARHFKFRESFTTKKRLIRRLTVPLSVDDPFMGQIGTNLLEIVAAQINLDWPTKISVAYSYEDTKHLPIDIKRQDPAYDLGYTVGKFVGQFTNKFK